MQQRNDILLPLQHYSRKKDLSLKGSQRVYLIADEDNAERMLSRKHFIPTVMFLCAVNRLRYDYHHNVSLVVKYAFGLLVEMVPAQRSSENHCAGTLEMKPLIVNRDF